MSFQEPIRVAMVSLGCPKNLVDSEKMLALLAEAGCLVGAPVEQADVIIVNTCGFLSAARQESLDIISEAVAQKNAGRARRVVVAGCLVNRDAGKLFELAPGIDAIVGVNDRDDILRAVKGVRKQTRVTEYPFTGGKHSIASDAGRFRLTPRHTAYLRISEGCGQRCTFCTIPSIRGPFRSKPPQDVLAEARELIADGAVELNVIGQDTTTYGRDLDDSTNPKNLAALLGELDALDGVQWIRLMYAYPKRFTEELMDAIASSRHVVKYIDLPLQHISDPILRRMGRGVGRAATEKLLTNLRRRIPGLVLRTTFIVGFPGETEANFQELLGFIKDFRFDALGVFEFSPEEGTPSASMSGAVPADVKAARAQAAMLVQQKIAFAANRRKIGKKLEVLVDGTDAEGRCVGRYYGQAPDIDSVCILEQPASAGSIVRCTVKAAAGYDLSVEIDD